MLIYLVVFAFAIAFTMFGEYNLKKNSRKVGTVCFVIAVVIPCVLAALRKPGVGIDSGTYAYTDFQIARTSSSFSAYYIRSSVREVLYTIIVYLTSRISSSFFLLYFISQLLIIAPVYYSLFLIKDRRKELSLAVSYCAFLFLYYNLSLNIIRQSMATSFILLGYTLYKLNRKLIASTALLFICAVLIHSFAIIVAPSTILLDKIINDNKKDLWKKILIVGTILLAVINVDSIILLVAKIAPGIMTKYVNTFNYINRSGLSYGDTLMKLVFFIACVVATKKKVRKKEFSLKSYTFLGAVGMAFQFVSIVSEYLIRISYYYQFFMIVPIGSFYASFVKNNKITMKVVSVILLFLYWYIVYVNWDWHGTMPFELASQ